MILLSEEPLSLGSLPSSNVIRGIMTTPANQPSSKRRLLWRRIAAIRAAIGQHSASVVGDAISTSDIRAQRHFAASWSYHLRSAESVQQVRNKLRAEAYRSMPRLFFSPTPSPWDMQAWRGATDTISRPFDAKGILQASAAFPRAADSTRRPAGKS